MRAFWRLLLLCLMALALPVQGFAAAGGVHCGAMHERMHAAVAQDHHHHHAAAADDHDAGQGGQGGQGDQGGLGAAFKCSACAACCVAIGLPATTLLLPALRADAGPPSIASAGVAVFLTSGPERPPRGFLV